MLLLKMVRDVRQNFSQFITILLMILLSMATYSGIEGYMHGMQGAADRFYEKSNLQDLNVRGDLSEKEMGEIAENTNVKIAEGKLVFRSQILNLLRQNEAEPKQSEQKLAEHELDRRKLDGHELEINLISSNEIAKFEVKEGMGFSREAEKIWIDAYFAEKNHLRVGDIVRFSYYGKPQKAHVAGIIYTPDHVYAPKNGSDIVPNYEKYGYAYLDYQSFFGKDRSKNEKLTQIMVKVIDGSKINETKAQIQEKIGKRGIVSKMRDEPTVKVYQGEIDENTSIMGIFTGFFVLIAILSVMATMTRLIKRDRTKIGTLKALGFANWRIAWHYISYGVFLGVLGGAVGILFGTTVISPFFLERVMQFFELPNYQVRITGLSIVIYLSVVTIIGLACFLAARKTIKQNATEILKPEQPKINQRELRLTTNRFFAKLSFITRWNVRDMLRNRGRIATTLVGVAGAIALVVLAFGAYSSMQNFIKLETEVVNNFAFRAKLDEEKLRQSKQQKSDMVQKNKNKAEIMVKTREELERQLAEAFERNSEQKPIELITDNDEAAETSNLFVDNTKGEIQFLDMNRKKTQLTENGVYLSRKMAQKYNFNIGDELRWRFIGENHIYDSKIVGLLIKQQDQNLSVNKPYFESLGLKYQPDTFYLNERENSEKSELLNYLDIQSKETLANGLKKMLDTMIAVLSITLILAAFLGGVIFYNMGVLSFVEQELQLTTLKVLGFTNGKLSKIFTWQNILITVIASLVGMPLGVALTDYIYRVSVDELYDIQTHITLLAYVTGVLGTLLLSVLISKLLARKIKKIDMVKTLKTGE